MYFSILWIVDILICAIFKNLFLLLKLLKLYNNHHQKYLYLKRFEYL